MSTGSTRSYRFGQKNNWRRSVWNEVLRRTNGREKTEPILYLAGPQDIDREIAVSKGVPLQNLIAIDKSRDNIQRIRERGLPALDVDVFSVLESWPDNRPVAAIMLDLCGGFTMQVADVYDVLERKPLRNAVVMLNLLRGRDSWSNRIREFIAEAHDGNPVDLLTAVSHWSYGPLGPPGGDCLDHKHRAMQLLVFHAVDTWQVVRKQDPSPLTDDDVLGRIVAAGLAFKGMDPHFYSYKSGALTFDSAVFQHLSRFVERMPKALVALADAEVHKNHDGNKSMGVIRKLAAMLAVRTSRIASLHR